MPPPPATLMTAQSASQIQTREQRRDPRFLVQLARKHTSRAIATLAELLDDAEQPSMVRVRCAEILLDRGYGKAPVAVLIGSEKPGEGGGAGLSVMEKVEALRAAAAQSDGTIDLEAASITEASIPTPTPDAIDIPEEDDDDPVG